MVSLSGLIAGLAACGAEITTTACEHLADGCTRSFNAVLSVHKLTCFVSCYTNVGCAGSRWHGSTRAEHVFASDGQVYASGVASVERERERETR